MHPYLLPSFDTVCIIHEIVLEEFGGLKGMPHPEYIESALYRPQNYMALESNCDIHLVAALILEGIARNHAFADGNKRTALISMLMVYNLNSDKKQRLSYDLHMNKKFEELVMGVVKEKPSIKRIRTELIKLIDEFSI